MLRTVTRAITEPVCEALNDIVNALEADSLGAETTQSRRLQDSDLCGKGVFMPWVVREAAF